MATEGKSRSGLGAIAKSAGIDASALKRSSDGESYAGSEQKEMAEADDIPPPGPRVLRLGSERGNRQEYRTMAGSRMRDERGRFTDEDDDDRGRSSSSRRRDDDDDRSYRSRGRENGGSGWYGDSRGHAEAAHRGWETRRSEGRYQDEDEDYRSGYGRGSRSRYEEDDRRGYCQGGGQGGGQYRSGSSSGGRMSEGSDRDRGQGGWFGDSEGHSEASRRGWDERRSSGRYEDDDDDRRRRMRSSSRDDDDDDRLRADAAARAAGSAIARVIPVPPSAVGNTARTTTTTVAAAAAGGGKSPMHIDCGAHTREPQFLFQRPTLQEQRHHAEPRTTF